MMLNMNEINQMSADIRSQKMSKIAAENTALDGCAEDFSDVSFELGKPSTEIAALKLVIIAAAIYGGRVIWKRLPVELMLGESANSIMIKVAAIVALVVIVLLCLILLEGTKAKISVKQKTLYYKGRSYESKEISHIILKALGGIQVYSKGKVVAKGSQADDNAEKLLTQAE